MNLSVQFKIAILLSIAIDNGNAQTLDFWYTGRDLNCRFYSVQSNERPFDIDVRPFWQFVQNEYCKSKDGTVIKIDKTGGKEKKCYLPDLMTLEIGI